MCLLILLQKNLLSQQKVSKAKLKMKFNQQLLYLQWFQITQTESADSFLQFWAAIQTENLRNLHATECHYFL